MIGAVLRVRLRSPVHYLPFVFKAVQLTREVEHAPGLVGAKSLLDRRRTFWILSVWQTREAMDAFYRSDAHAQAVPYVFRWCDEASVAEWELEGVTDGLLPSWDEAHRILVEKARLTKLPHPNAQHQGREFASPRRESWLNTRVVLPKGSPSGPTIVAASR